MTDAAHRQLLIRCNVLNAEGESSIRFVERNHFRMWQYLMANKHHIRIISAGISLWLPEQEWRSQAQIFTRAGRVESVSCLNLAAYDSQTGLCNTTQRYVLQKDAHLLQVLLLDRLPASIKARGDYVLEWEPGRAVLQNESEDLPDISRLLGDQFALSDKSDG